MKILFLVIAFLFPLATSPFMLSPVSAQGLAENEAIVYRFRNINNGGYLYTASENEYKDVLNLPEWEFEGVKFKVFTEQVEGSVAMHRFFKNTTGTHLFTVSEDELTTVQKLEGYTYEGEKFYVMPIEESVGSLQKVVSKQVTDLSSPTTIYRFYNPSTGIHLFTVSEVESNNIITNLSDIWIQETATFSAVEVDGSVLSADNYEQMTEYGFEPLFPSIFTEGYDEYIAWYDGKGDTPLCASTIFSMTSSNLPYGANRMVLYGCNLPEEENMIMIQSLFFEDDTITQGSTIIYDIPVLVPTADFLNPGGYNFSDRIETDTGFIWGSMPDYIDAIVALGYP